MMSCCGTSPVDLRKVRSRARTSLSAALRPAAAIVACGAAFASVAAAQAVPEPPASCATSFVASAAWNHLSEIAVTPEAVEFTWNVTDDLWTDRDDGFAYVRGANNSWVLCLPLTPGSPDSYVALDKWHAWPVTTIFEPREKLAGLDYDSPDEAAEAASMVLRGLAPGVDYWAQYAYVEVAIKDDGTVVFDDRGRPVFRRASTNWLHFRLEGPLQAPAAVDVHGAGVWGPRRLASNEITLYWTAFAGGGVVESFQVREKEAAGESWSDWQDVPGGPEARWHTLGGLTPGTPYAFEVRAINSIGAGPPTRVTGTPGPDSRTFEAPCPLDDRLGEPSALHNEKVRMTRQEEEWVTATFSGTAAFFGWFVDGEPTAGSVEYNVCRPVFPGSNRYRVETAMRNPEDLSLWGRLGARDEGYTVAIDGLATEDQYWIQAVHQPFPDDGGEVELTTWVRSDEAFWRFEVKRRADSETRHWLPVFERRMGYDSFPGILERFGRAIPLRAPAAPGGVAASESSPGTAVVRWEPSVAGGKVKRWEYRIAEGVSGGWTSWRAMPGGADRLTHVVDGLTPGERYTFEVRGANSEHTGESVADSLQLSSGPVSGCAADAGSAGEPTAVCLGAGRFRFEVTWESPHDGRTGAGMMRRLTDNTGVATFFDRDNVELVFKVLDGSEVNGRHWVFYGGLTDLGYTLTVTDTQTGETKSYRNEPGDLCGGGDTSAFGAARASSTATDLFRPPMSLPGGRPTVWTEALRAGAGCPSDALCLAGSRFEVTVDWTNPTTGLAGRGRPVPGTDNTGYMTFFSPDNVELAIKVLDGRAFNDSHWVFATGLTDLDYTITVKDTLRAGVKTYSSRDAGPYCTIQDVDAFPQ